VTRGLAPAIGLLLGLAPALAQAQTNIDEGKTPAQIYSSDCATCHKSSRGLAGGRGSLALRSFLAEHYTSSKDQAAALAAYVLGAGGGDNVPAQTHPPKPAENARLQPEEPKPRKKEKGAAPAAAKLQPPVNDEAKPDRDLGVSSVPSIVAEPSPGGSDRRPVADRHEPRAHRKEPESVPPPQPTAVLAEPAAPHESSAATVSSDVSPGRSAAVPASADTGNGSPVPRDNIPD